MRDLDSAVTIRKMALVFAEFGSPVTKLRRHYLSREFTQLTRGERPDRARVGAKGQGKLVNIDIVPFSSRLRQL